MRKASLVIRTVTVPPVFAAALLVILSVTDPAGLGGAWHLAAGIGTLVLLPLAAYPMQRYLPRYKDRGREGQRSLAMVFSFAGYLLGAALAFATGAPASLKIVHLEYLLSGVAILVSNKCLRRRASGHACGIVGPVLLLFDFGLYLPALAGAALIAAVFVSSLRTKRHTAPQLVGGSLIPAAALLIVHLFFR